MDRLPEYPILLERNWFSQSTSLILSLPFLKNLHNCPIIYKIHPKLFRKGLQNLVTITFLELFLVSFFPLLYSFGLSNKFFSTIPSLGTKFFSLSTAALVALFTFLFFFFFTLIFPYHNPTQCLNFGSNGIKTNTSNYTLVHTHRPKALCLMDTGHDCAKSQGHQKHPKGQFTTQDLLQLSYLRILDKNKSHQGLEW